MKKAFFIAVCLISCVLGETVDPVQENHFLSFIIPCFNCANTVGRSIDSIYEQGITVPFEVICTNDASTDNTLEILRKYETTYTNLHVYCHEENQGGGAASNTCVKYSRGDLLFRLDSDNALSLDSINKLVDLVEKTGCDGASVEEIRYHCGNYQKVAEWIYKAPNNICDLHHCITNIMNPAASGNYLFTRKSYDKAGGYPQERSGSDTFCFGFKQFATGSKIAILPQSFYWHFRNPQGYWYREEATGNNQKIAIATLLAFKEVFSQETVKILVAGKRNYAHEIQEGRLHLASSEILDCLFQGYEWESRQEPKRALEVFEQAKVYGCISEKIDEKITQLKK